MAPPPNEQPPSMREYTGSLEDTEELVDEEGLPAEVLDAGAEGASTEGAARGPTETAPAGFTFAGLFGGILIIVAIAGIILQFALPVLYTTGAQGTSQETQYRDDLKDSGPFAINVEYRDRALDWPVQALIATILIGLALVALDLTEFLTPTAKANTQLGMLVGTALAGFVVLLTAFRWFGGYFTGLMDEGETAFHLHALPYVNLVLGSALLGACAWLMREHATRLKADGDHGLYQGWGTKIPLLTVLVCAAGLLLSPLLPYAMDSGDAFGTPSQAYGESDLETFRAIADQGFGAGFGIGSTLEDLAKPAKDLGWVRIGLWLGLVTSLAAFAAGLVERRGKDPLVHGGAVHIYLLNIAWAGIALIFSILMLVHVPEMPGDPSPGFNFVPQLASLALVGLVLLFLAKVTRRYLPVAQEHLRQVDEDRDDS